MRDTFGNLLTDHLSYMHAYQRQEHAIGLLSRLIDKVEERTKAG